MSGKPDYDAGDVVERVMPSPSGHFAVGGLYRCEAVLPPDSSGDWGALISGKPAPNNIFGGWKAYGFRKVRPASDEFTRQMRSLRPIKAREDA